MSVFLPTTTVSVRKHDTTGAVEQFDSPVYTTGPVGVRAHIGRQRGAEENVGRSLAVVEAELLADPIPGLSNGDQIVDANTAEVWEVLWVQDRHGLGLRHTKAGLRREVGA